MVFNSTYPYNITALQNASSITSVMDYLNKTVNLNGFSIWGVLSIAIFIIIIMALRRYSIESALAVASFVTTILTLLLWNMGYINFIYPSIFLVIAGASTLWLYIKPS